MNGENHIALIIKKAWLTVFALFLFTACVEGTDNKKTEADFIPPPRDPVTVITAGVTDPDNVLDVRQATLLRKYAESYRETLTYLKPADVRKLYLDSEGDQAYINETAFGFLRRVRSDKDIDLTLEYMEIEYTVTGVLKRNDSVNVYLKESNTQKFRHFNEPSYTAGIIHVFTIKEDNGQWYIEKHFHEEDFYLLVENVWENRRKDLSREEKEEYVFDLLMADAAESIRDNPSWQNNTYIPEGEFSYDRLQAVEYVKKYWNTRNYDTVYTDYDDYGGNCQNFCSQALYAGGISMDYSGPYTYQWKWFGEYPNEAATPYGRSYSWRGVDEFYSYATSGNTNGMVCVADRPLTMAEKGDILQFGAYNEWRHSTFITDIIYDENGELLDFAIASNTADRLNYPASAYAYSAVRIIHIMGEKVN